MVRRSVTTRVAKWAARMQGEAVSPAMSRCLAHALPALTTAMEKAVAVEIAVRGCIDALDIMPFEVISYFAFGRQCAMKADKFAGEALAVEVSCIIALWTARGLNQSNLEAIRDDVFGIGEPMQP